MKNIENHDITMILFSIAMFGYTLTLIKEKDKLMKTKRQQLFEAQARQKEIAKKTKKLGVMQSGNVKTSFARNTKEFLLNMGFYQKGEKHAPTKDSISEKRLPENVVSIDVRKKAE